MKRLLLIIGIILFVCAPVHAKRTLRGPIYISGEGTSPFSLRDWNTMNGVSDGDGTEGDPFIITGFEIDATGYEYAIKIEDADYFFELSDLEVYDATKGDNGSGIFIDNCDNATIDDVYSHHNDYGCQLTYLTTATVTGSDFNSNLNSGLFLNSVTSSTVYNTDFHYNTLAGIELNNSGSTSSNGNSFSAVDAYDNRQSFFLNGSDYNEFDGCCSYEATRDGLTMQDSHYNYFSILIQDSEDGGVVMYLSDYNEFEDCTIDNNGYREGYGASTHGFFLDHSSYNEIHDCTLTDNNEYAVFVDDDDSDGNRIFYNNITGNNDGGTQAWDSAEAGQTEWFDDTVPGYCGIGNYWGSCSSINTFCYYYSKLFCIYDYQIDGWANSEDEWPVPSAF